MADILSVLQRQHTPLNHTQLHYQPARHFNYLCGFAPRTRKAIQTTSFDVGTITFIKKGMKTRKKETVSDGSCDELEGEMFKKKQEEGECPVFGTKHKTPEAGPTYSFFSRCQGERTPPGGEMWS